MDTELSIRDLLKEKLLFLADSITTNERNEAEKVVDISRPTLDKYLSGDIAKIETATRLVTFLSEKVKARYELINGATNLMHDSQ